MQGWRGIQGLLKLWDYLNFIISLRLVANLSHRVAQNDRGWRWVTFNDFAPLVGIWGRWSSGDERSFITLQMHILSFEASLTHQVINSLVDFGDVRWLLFSWFHTSLVLLGETCVGYFPPKWWETIVWALRSLIFIEQNMLSRYGLVSVWRSNAIFFMSVLVISAHSNLFRWNCRRVDALKVMVAWTTHWPPHFVVIDFLRALHTFKEGFRVVHCHQAFNAHYTWREGGTVVYNGSRIRQAMSESFCVV